MADQTIDGEAFTKPHNDARLTAWLPDLLYTCDGFERGLALVSDAAGRIVRLAREGEIEGKTVRLKGRALLPGLVNAHSHAFQRVIRGRTEYRTAGKGGDNFWTWREMMYSAATRLTPEDLYDASRMAFLEMARSGITSVGEFHYIHHAPSGAAYDDPNLLSKTVARAARDVGLRICLLRVAYARSGYGVAPNPLQARFIETDAEVFLRNTERLRSELSREDSEGAWVGVAPHSVRAVPLPYLREVFHHGKENGLPIHMHVAEQPAELEACVREHGRTPIMLLETEGLLDERFTGIHGIHVTNDEAHVLARARALVCACPTTERNLGDGLFPADLFFKAGVRVSLGTDSHTQIDLLEDARELEYNMRLKRLERVVLASADDAPSALAARLFDCATRHGAESLGIRGGALLQPGLAADFFALSLDDPSLAGAAPDNLLSHIVFSLSPTAISDVVVGGKMIVEDGRHAAEREIVENFIALQKRLWS